MVAYNPFGGHGSHRGEAQGRMGSAAEIDPAKLSPLVAPLFSPADDILRALEPRILLDASVAAAAVGVADAVDDGRTSGDKNDKPITSVISRNLKSRDVDENPPEIKLEVQNDAVKPELIPGTKPTLPSDMAAGPKADADIGSPSISADTVEYTISTDLANLNKYANELPLYGDVTGDDNLPYILEFDLTGISSGVSPEFLVVSRLSPHPEARPDYLEIIVTKVGTKLRIRLGGDDVNLRTITNLRDKIGFIIADPSSSQVDRKELTIIITYGEAVQLNYRAADQQQVNSKFYAIETTDPTQDKYDKKHWNIYYDPDSPPDGSTNPLKLFNIVVSNARTDFVVIADGSTQNGIRMDVATDDATLYTVLLVERIAGDVDKEFIILERQTRPDGSQIDGVRISLKISFKSLSYFMVPPYNSPGIVQLNGYKFTELPQEPDTPANERTWRLVNPAGEVIAQSGSVKNILYLNIPSADFVELEAEDPDDYLEVARDRTADSGSLYRYEIRLKRTLAAADGKKAIVLEDSVTKFRIKLFFEVKYPNVRATDGRAEGPVGLVTDGKDGTSAATAYEVQVPANVPVGELVSFALNGSAQRLSNSDFTLLKNSNEPYFQFSVRDGRLILERTRGIIDRNTLLINQPRVISVEVRGDGIESGSTVYLKLRISRIPSDRTPTITALEAPTEQPGIVADEIPPITQVTDPDGDQATINGIRVISSAARLAANKVLAVVIINDDDTVELDASDPSSAGFRLERLGASYKYKLYYTGAIESGLSRTLKVVDKNDNSLTISLEVFLAGKALDFGRAAEPTLPVDMPSGLKANANIEFGSSSGMFTITTDITSLDDYANEDDDGDDVLPVILEFDLNNIIAGIPLDLLAVDPVAGTAAGSGRDRLQVKVDIEAGKLKIRLDGGSDAGLRAITDTRNKISLVIVDRVSDPDNPKTLSLLITYEPVVQVGYAASAIQPDGVYARDVTDPGIHKYDEKHWDVYYDPANPPVVSADDPLDLFRISATKFETRDQLDFPTVGGVGSLDIRHSEGSDFIIMLRSRVDEISGDEFVGLSEIRLEMDGTTTIIASLRVYIHFKPIPYYPVPDKDQPPLTSPDDNTRFVEVSPAPNTPANERRWRLTSPAGEITNTPRDIIYLDLGSDDFREDTSADRGNYLRRERDADADDAPRNRYRYRIILRQPLSKDDAPKTILLRNGAGVEIKLSVEVKEGLEVLDWRVVGPVIFDGSGGRDGSQSNPYKLTVPANVAIGDVLTFRTSGGAEFTPDQEFDTIDTDNRQYFTLITRHDRGTAVLQRITGDGGTLTPASADIAIVLRAGGGATDPLARWVYINLEIVAAAADRAPKFIGAAESSPSYADLTTVAVPSTSTVSAIDSDGDGEVDTVRVSSTAASIPGLDVIAIITVDDDSEMRLTAPSGYTLSRLGPSYTYALTRNLAITGRLIETLRLVDGDGNSLEIKLEVWLNAAAPTFTKDADDNYEKPQMPMDMAEGPKADADIQAESTEGEYTINTDLENLNAYANELAPYGDENDDPDTLPYILEFNYDDIDSTVPLGSIIITEMNPDGMANPNHLKVKVDKDIANNKLKIRLDGGDLTLRTIEENKRIVFLLKDPRGDSLNPYELTVIVTYRQVQELDYSVPINQPLVYAVDATDPRFHKYDEKVWDIYYDPASQLVGSAAAPLDLFRITVSPSMGFSIAAGNIGGDLALQADGANQIIQLLTQVGTKTTKQATITEVQDTDGADGLSIRLTLNFKPLPYYPLPTASQPPISGAGDATFVELPQARDAPINERSWRLISSNSVVAAADGTIILLLDLGSPNFAEVEGEDSGNYLEIERDVANDDPGAGKYRYKIKLNRDLTVDTGRRPIVLEDEETKASIKLYFSVEYPDLQISDPQGADPVTLDIRGLSGGETSPYRIVVPVNVPVAELMSFALSGGSSYEVTEPDLGDIQDGDDGYFEFAIRGDRLVFKRITGAPVKSLLGGDRAPRTIHVTVGGDGVKDKTIYFDLTKVAQTRINPRFSGLEEPTVQPGITAGEIDIHNRSVDGDGDAITGNNIEVTSPHDSIAAGTILAVVTIEDDSTMRLVSSGEARLERLGASYKYKLYYVSEIEGAFTETLRLQDEDGNELTIQIEVTLGAKKPKLAIGAAPLLPDDMKDGPKADVDEIEVGTIPGQFTITTDLGNLNDYANEKAPYGEVTGTTELPIILEFKLDDIVASVLSTRVIATAIAPDNQYLRVEIDVRDGRLKIRLDEKVSELLRTISDSRNKIGFTLQDPRSTDDTTKTFIITITYEQALKLGYSVPDAQPVDARFYALEMTDPRINKYDKKVWNIYYAPGSPLDGSGPAITLFNLDLIGSDPAFDTITHGNTQNGILLERLGGDVTSYAIKLVEALVGDATKQFNIVEMKASGENGQILLEINFISLSYFSRLPYSLDGILHQPDLDLSPDGELFFQEQPQAPGAPNNERTWRLTNPAGLLDLVVTTSIIWFDLPSNTFEEDPSKDPGDYLGAYNRQDLDREVEGVKKYRYVIELKKDLSAADGKKTIVLVDSVTKFRIKLFVEVKQGQVTVELHDLEVTYQRSASLVIYEGQGKAGSVDEPLPVRVRTDAPVGELLSFILAGGSNYQLDSDLAALDDINELYIRFFIRNDNRLVLERIRGAFPRDRLEPEGPITISVEISGDDLRTRTIYFTLRLEPPPPVEISDPEVPAKVADRVTIDVSGGKDGSSPDKAYEIRAEVDVPVGELASFNLDGGSNYQLDSDLAALDDINEGYIRFFIRDDNRLVIERVEGSPSRARLIPEGPTAISVEISGDDILDTTIYFTLQLDQLPPVRVSDGREEHSTVTLNDRGGRDGSEARPYIIGVRVNAPVGDLVSFALDGGSNYDVNADLGNLDDDNEPYFQFAIKDGRLVLKRISGTVLKSLLDTDEARTISATVSGDDISDTTIYFTLQLDQLPPVGIFDRQAADGVTFIAGAGRDGSSADKAYTVEIVPSVAIGDVFSFALRGGSNYRADADLDDFDDDNEPYFQFVIKNGRLVLERIEGTVPIAILKAEGPTPISVEVSGDGAASRTVYFNVEIVEPPEVTFDTDTDGSFKKPLLPEDMPRGPKADADIQAGERGQYTIITDLDNLNAYANEQDPYGDVTSDGNLPDILEFSLADITARIPSADLEVTVKTGAGFLAVEIRQFGGKLIIRMDESASEALRTITMSRNKIGFTLTDATHGGTLDVIVTYEQAVKLIYSSDADNQPAGVYARDVTDRTEHKYDEKHWDVYYDPTTLLDGSVDVPLDLFYISVGPATMSFSIEDGNLGADLHLKTQGGYKIIQLLGRVGAAETKQVVITEVKDAEDGASVRLTINFKRIPYYPSNTAAELAFEELPQAPNTPANERTWRLVNPGGSAAPTGATVPIARIELPNGDFTEDEAADPNNYLSINPDRNFPADRDGYVTYMILLNRRLSAADGQKTLVIEDESGFKMRFVFEVKQSLQVTDGLADNPAVTLITASKDGSEASPYEVEAAVDVKVGDMVSFALDGGSNYQMDPDFTKLRPDKRDLFAFEIRNGRLVLVKKAGSLTVEGPTAVSVTISGTDIVDKTISFTLEILPLQVVGTSDGRAEDGVTLVTASKDGSEASPYEVTVRADVPVGKLVSFALSGGRHSYNIVLGSADFAALDGANQPHFWFAIEGDRLVLNRRAGDLTADTPKKISVAIGGDGVEETTIYFRLSIDDTPPELTIGVPSLPMDMPAGPKADADIHEPTAGRYTITTDIDNLNDYANEKAPYGEVTRDDKLPDILEFDLADITLSADFVVTVKSGAGFLSVEIRKEGGKLIIRMDEGASESSRTIMVGRNKIGFILTDPDSGSTLDVTVTYEQAEKMDYRVIPIHDGVYVKDATDRKEHGYNEKHWEVYYDPDNPLVGSDGVPLDLFRINIEPLHRTHLIFYSDGEADDIFIHFLGGIDSPTQPDIVISQYLVRLKARVAEPKTEYVDFTEKRGLEVETRLRVYVNFKPIPYYPLPDDRQPSIDGSKFVERPQAQNAPANKRTWVFTDSSISVIKVDDPRPIVYLDMGSPDFVELESEDLGDYLELVRDSSADRPDVGRYAYAINLKRTLQATDGQKTLVFVDSKTDLRMEITFIITQALEVYDGRTENPKEVTLVTASKDGSEASPYEVTVRADVEVGNMVSFALGGGRNYRVVSSQLDALDDVNEPYFRFVIKNDRLFLQRIRGALPRDKLTPEGPTVISVTIRSDDILLERTVYFSLEPFEAPPVTFDDGRAENAAVTLVTASKDGTAASPYGVELPVNIPADDLVSFALSGGSNYRVVSSQLDALDDVNEPYFRFVIKNDRLFLERIRGEPPRDRLAAEGPTDISVVIGGDRVKDTTFHFTLRLDPQVEISEPRITIGTEVVIKDGEEPDDPDGEGDGGREYEISVRTDIPVGELLSVRLSGGSNYVLRSQDLTALDDANEPYFRFVIKDSTLVFERIAGDPPRDKLVPADFTLIWAIVGGDDLADRPIRIRLRIYEPRPGQPRETLIIYEEEDCSIDKPLTLISFDLDSPDFMEDETADPDDYLGIERDDTADRTADGKYAYKLMLKKILGANDGKKTIVLKDSKTGKMEGISVMAACAGGDDDRNAIISAIWRPSADEQEGVSGSAPMVDVGIDGVRQLPEEEANAVREAALRTNDQAADVARGVIPDETLEVFARRVVEAEDEFTAMQVDLSSSRPFPRQSPSGVVSAVSVLKPEIIVGDDGVIGIRFRGEQRVIGVVGRLPRGVTFDAALGQFSVDGGVYRGWPAIVTVKVRGGDDEDDEKKRRLGVGKVAERLLKIDLAPLIEKARAIADKPNGRGKPAKAPDGDGAISDAAGRASRREDAGGQDANGVADGDAIGNVANGVPPTGVPPNGIPPNGIPPNGVANGNGHANDWRGFTAKLERASQDFDGELDALMAQLRKLDKGQKA